MNTFKIILAVVLPFGAFSSQAQQSEYFFQSKKLKQITTVDDCYQSYNIEMAQIVGGQFWKPYKDMTSLPSSTGGLTYNVSEKNTEMYSPLPPVNLADKRLITLAKGLAPAYVRVSGTWANSIYFQDDDKPKLDKAPNGFANVLTRSQWKGVLDFLKTTNSKLVTSFAVSNGVRDNNGVWTPIEAQKILNFTNKMGGTITAAELFNEPNIPTSGGDINNDYNDENFAKDQTVYRNWVKENTQTDALFAAENPPLVYLYTNCKTVHQGEIRTDWERYEKLGIRYWVRTGRVPNGPVTADERQYRVAYISPGTQGLRVIDLGAPGQRKAWGK